MEIVTENKTAEIFSSLCFWDCDRTKLNLDESKNYIITRVISHGNTDDITKLYDYYGWDTVKEEVVKIRYLNDKILNWLSCIFKIPKEQFRCYNNRSIF